MRRYVPYVVALALVCGIIFGYYANHIVPILVIGAGIVLIVQIRAQRKNLYVIVLCTALCVGCLRVAVFRVFEIERRLDGVLGKEISCDGIVVDIPQYSGSRVSLPVSHDGIRILLTTSAYRSVLYGDYVSCSGILKKVERESLWRKGIFYEISPTEFSVLEHDQGSRILSFLYEIKYWFVESLYTIFSSPQGELIAGLTIEGSDAISKELKEQFRRTSLSHIVALSGTNVSIIIEVVFVLLSRFKRIQRFTAGFVFIWAFALMTGMTSTILRASCMALLSLIAELFHRKSYPLRALCLVSILMITINPLVLLFDVSFQLSFTATLSMIVVMPLLEKSILKKIPFKIVRETLLTTISAQILITPLIVYYAGSLSTIVLMSNLLVLPMVPIAMLFGTLSVVSQFVWPILTACALIAHVTVAYIIFVVQYLSSFEFALYEINISIYSLVIVYGVIIVVLSYLTKKTDTKPVF